MGWARPNEYNPFTETQPLGLSPRGCFLYNKMDKGQRQRLMMRYEIDEQELDYIIEIVEKIPIEVYYEVSRAINGSYVSDRVDTPISKSISCRTPTMIYVMVDKHTSLYKIGKSDNPTKRENTFLSQAPLIKLLFSFKADFSLELQLHKVFENKRVRGEWFKLNEQDLDYIKKIGGVK